MTRILTSPGFFYIQGLAKSKLVACFQIWAICTSAGAGVWYEPYCGRDTKILDGGLGQGPNVVVDLISKVRKVLL